MTQLKKPQIKWTDEKIESLRTDYPLGNKQILCEKLGVSRKVLKYAAKRFGVKSLLDKKKYRANKLLDGSLQSYYWHGFIMADGHISNRNSLKITLSNKDHIHLCRLCEFLDIPNDIIKIKEINTSYGITTTSELLVSDVDTCNKLRVMYNVGNNKTTLPPDITHLLLHDDKVLAFFIGFFDGDGCFDIRKNVASGMKIECHENWFSVLEIFSIILKQILDIESSLKFSSRGYAILRVSRYRSYQKLKIFGIEKQLPVLRRKWVNVDEYRTFNLKK